MWYIKNTEYRNEYVYYFPKVWSYEEIDRIHETSTHFESTVGETFGSHDDKKVRNSEVKWLDVSNPHAEWIYRKMVDIVDEVNKTRFNFNLSHLENLQYTIYNGSYNAPGHYTYHTDENCTQTGNNDIRKLSVVTLLSDPSDFEGGQLEVNTGNVNPVNLNKGDVVVFPSFVMHKVTPVTAGRRCSLVCWAHGPSWV